MKSIYKLLSVIALVGFTITGCDLDINVDPNDPATVPNSQLLSASQVATAWSLGTGGGLGQSAGLWVHQTMIRSSADGYASTGDNANISNPWGTLYASALTDLETIIRQGTETEEHQYVGIAKMMKAYIFNMMVDAWGDIPFSEAGLGATNPFPVFDNDQDIYNALFPLIDEAIADMAKPAPASNIIPGTDDLIYGGDIAKWRRFGKVLKLKMYNTMRKVQDVNAEIVALVNDADVAGFADDFEMPYVNSAVPENRNPAWVSIAGRTTWFSIYFYEIMTNKSTLNPILSGISDPRLNYYLYNSLGSSNPTPQNPTEYRDNVNPNYIGIWFSSQSVNQGFDHSRGISMPGLYYAGGKFDNAGVGGAILISSAPGNAPQRFLTRYMVSYIRAELALEGVTAEDPRVMFSNAIDQSFAKVNSIKAIAASTAPDISAAARDAYRNAVLAKYDAGDNAVKLEHIMTQKWIANFGNPLESYTDYRRTGLPKMFDPLTDGNSDTQLGRGYPLSFPYRADDVNLNPNAPAQKLIAEPASRVFWDVD
jgi:hypothetical protein